ncbi:hypothetical protein SELMODRAFT_438859 [Selaginella moellendorffii]|uniref:Uncharacterized protein SPC98-1 n=1 Tax=Selaginella moellendorffii TaxID=88036 RepID=D8QZY8_SELML|nr:gamma-tubulin complex component 3 [Selaginella moellendorffii]EFJ34488.1 hypothetical protein SELMODRAFT_438859 [Selaginella moellendorffii]|eukprot:XP_002964155.1 gamma-tubulin complex component 3 [Selaginella moellendorffii]
MEAGDGVAGLVKQLVQRIFPAAKQQQQQQRGDGDLDAVADQAFRYAMRIVGSRIVSSLASDEAAMAESIKRQLVMEGRSSDALTFADLHRRLAALSGPGSIENRWAMLYLLRAVAEDQRRERAETRGTAVPFTSTISAHAAAGGLPALPDSTNEKLAAAPQNGGGGGGVLVLARDSDTVKATALREFGDLTQESFELSEAALVRDVLYACQGIDGRYVRFDKEADGYIVDENLRIPRATRVLVRRLCEVGWLFKRVQGHISETLEQGTMEVIGTVGQALSSALQEELSEYYRLMAVLEAQLHNQIPFLAVGETGKSVGNYLSLRRLWVWLAEPLARMRLMAVLVDDCKCLRGGAMAGAIHAHAQHGDPLVRSFMSRLLRRVCSPLFEMVRRWVLEGEVDDLYGEFFILAQPVKAEALWREGYSLQSGMLPSFIPEPLAQRILRTGKSINFLRVCCEDQQWATEAAEALAAAGASANAGSLGYGETEVLETLVVEAAGRIDRHVIKIIYERYKFRDHCLAIKRYLLLGQGDFIQYLMDLVGPDLSQPANTVSSFKLAGLLESAIRALNAQYDDTEVLDRLRVKMMPHGDGDRGWDVFSLEYNARDPLTTIFTEQVMGSYLRIFNFLWRLKRVEHALSATWQTMKPNCSLGRPWTSVVDGAVKSQLVAVLRRCQTLRTEMNHFVTNLQYYIMFEVLEYSWANFLEEMEEAHDLDELIAAHEKYLGSIMEKALLGERSQLLSKTLFTLFDLILRFRGLADRLYENAREVQTRGRNATKQHTTEFFATMGEEMVAIAAEYSSLLEGFIAQLPVQQHVDLKFLSFRLDFSEFYTRQHMHTPNVRLKIKRTATPKS